MDHNRRGAARSGDGRAVRLILGRLASGQLPRAGLPWPRWRGMLHGMATNPMDPATAVTWGPFIRAAYEQYVSDPGEVNPSSIKNMPAGYTLVRTIQMTDFFGPVQTRVFY